MCHELIHGGQDPVSNIIDELFCWASEQPSSNTTSVEIAITSNQIRPTNMVSYAHGLLLYSPGCSLETVYCPPSFASAINGITQYFSDRLYDTEAPFNAAKTDRLTVYISRQGIAATTYSITLKSLRYGIIDCFAPAFDAKSKVISGVIAEGGVLITVGLYNPVSDSQVQAAAQRSNHHAA